MVDQNVRTPGGATPSALQEMPQAVNCRDYLMLRVRQRLANRCAEFDGRRKGLWLDPDRDESVR
jgi:hypothetical protein